MTARQYRMTCSGQTFFCIASTKSEARGKFRQTMAQHSIRLRSRGRLPGKVRMSKEK
jgi:hypothetical protein